MRLVYFGTPEAAVPPLRALLGSRHEVVAVVTRPDRPRDRAAGRPEPAPVKQVARAAGRPVLEPPSGRDPGLVAALRAFGVPLGASCAYGQLLGPQVLAAFAAGVVNLHFSLLPAYRGAAPVQRALLAGETVTGVTTFLLDEGMDTGPILLRREVAVEPHDDAGSLTERLAHLGAELLLETVDRIEAGSLTPRPQPAVGASLAPRVSKAEARLDFTRPAGAVVAQVRAFTPNPGAWTVFRGGRLGVLRARVGALEPAAPARSGGAGCPVGTLRTAPGGELVVCAGQGLVVLERVRPAGRAAMSGADFARGARLHAGERLGA